MNEIIVAGGGIGGLAFALMAAEVGVKCSVFEASDRNDRRGAGINFLPHAAAEIAALGLLPELEAAGVLTRTLTFMNRQGQEIWTEPRGRFAGHPYPQISLHRAALREVLLTAC